MDSILEEEEEEDEEEEDTEFPSEILFRFLLGTLLSFSAGREGRNEVSVPRERGRGVCSPSGMGTPPAAATSPPAERPRSHRRAAAGDMGFTSATWHRAANSAQAPPKWMNSKVQPSQSLIACRQCLC